METLFFSFDGSVVSCQGEDRFDPSEWDWDQLPEALPTQAIGTFQQGEM